ncbi:MAG: MATE family efflux transporter, partial [Pseudomonadota bacterium]
MTEAVTYPPPATSWAAHIRATVALGLPLIGVQLAQMAIQVTDTLMIGRLGAEDLAAAVLATQLFFVAFIITSGFAHALVPIAAAAASAEYPRGVRRAARMGAWAVTLVAACLAPVLWSAEAVLLAIDQQPNLAVMAQDYLRIAMWGLFAFGLVLVFRGFLSALEDAGVVFWATVAAVPLNAGLNWLLIYGSLGAPEMGIRGAAVASVSSQVLTLALLVLYCHRSKVIRSYALFQRIWRPDWPMLGQIFALGSGISATLLAEVGLFAATSVMIGWIGTVPLAAHGISLQVVSVIFMIPMGLSSAATVRAGRALGRRDAEGLYRAAITVNALALGVAVIAAVIFWAVPEPLIRLFLDAENEDAAAIVAYGVPLL